MGITPPAGRQHETRKIKDLRSDQPSLSSNLRVVAAVMPVKDRTATHGYAERDITHHLSLSIRNGVYTNDAVKGSAHAAVHTYQSNMQGRCMAKVISSSQSSIGGSSMQLGETATLNCNSLTAIPHQVPHL
ncbi:hypothetical protein NOF04DRAFT_1407819 [Fusarium oxysporum II5]|nr:hypothetical protein NOF04DRAFT_1407819 [Fusarium oxysporum II5]